jgi:hypothetical protein
MQTWHSLPQGTLLDPNPFLFKTKPKSDLLKNDFEYLGTQILLTDIPISHDAEQLTVFR